MFDAYCPSVLLRLDHARGTRCIRDDGVSFIRWTSPPQSSVRSSIRHTLQGRSRAGGKCNTHLNSSLTRQPPQLRFEPGIIPSVVTRTNHYDGRCKVCNDGQVQFEMEMAPTDPESELNVSASRLCQVSIRSKRRTGPSMRSLLPLSTLKVPDTRSEMCRSEGSIMVICSSKLDM